MSDYAARKGLELKAFYNWKWRLSQLGILKRAKDTVSFQAVEIVPEMRVSECCRIGLPNGVWVEIDTGSDVRGIGQLLAVVHALK